MTVTEVADASSFAQQLQTAKTKNILVVVDFYATWCGPCKAIAPTVESLSSKYAKDAVFLKVDVDRVPDVSRDAGVQAMPSFGFYGEGSLVELMKGADPAGLEERIKRYAAQYTKTAFKGAGYTLGSVGASSRPTGSSSSSSHSSAPVSAGPPRKNPWAGHKQATADQMHPNFMPGKKSTATTSATSSTSSAAAPSTTKATPAARTTVVPTTTSTASAPAHSSTSSEATPSPSSASSSTLSSSSSSAKPPVVTPSSTADPVLLTQLLDMGFDSVRAQKALILSKNTDIEAAVGWLMEHQDDADIDVPLTQAQQTAAAAQQHQDNHPTAAAAAKTTTPEPQINLNELDEDERVLYEEVMKKKGKDGVVSSASTTGSTAASSAAGSKPVSQMTSAEKMAWLADKRAAVKAKKEKEALEKVKNEYKSNKGMTSAMNDLKEQREEHERQLFIQKKKKEEAEKAKHLQEVRAKLAAQKEQRKLEQERTLAALKKGKDTGTAGTAAK